MEQSQIQLEISGYIGKLLRDHFGKGPEGVYVSMGSTVITVYFRNFLAPIERVLMSQGQELSVQQTRDMLMQTLIPDIKAFIKVLTGIEIREFYYDWSLHNKSGLFVGMTSEPFPAMNPMEIEYSGQESIHLEIVNISKQAQKIPEELISFQLNERTLVVVRNGILVRIEKELIRLGFKETLKIAKRNLEKSLLHNTNHFELILQAKVMDVFVDWDFELDKSIIVFILNPNK